MHPDLKSSNEAGDQISDLLALSRGESEEKEHWKKKEEEAIYRVSDNAEK